MKSKKNESVSVEETVVHDVVQVAKADVEEWQKIITYTFADTDYCYRSCFLDLWDIYGEIELVLKG